MGILTKTAEEPNQDDVAFFDEKSPLGKRVPRRESIDDSADAAISAAEDIMRAVKEDDLAIARDAFEQLKMAVDAIEDDLVERDVNGTRRG